MIIVAAGTKGIGWGSLSSVAAVHNTMSKDSLIFLGVDETLVHEVMQLKHSQGLILVRCMWGANRSKRRRVEASLASRAKKPRTYLLESFPNAVTADAPGYEPLASALNCSPLSQALMVPAAPGLEVTSR